MADVDGQTRAASDAYDEEAEAVGWFGPEVAFGLMYKFIRPGQSLLDIGIGTGLAAVLFRSAGLRVYGMDVDPQMLDACRSKGFTDLALHDLTELPYPYRAQSLDHAACVGVLNFFKDPSPVVREVARILREGGLFVFAVGDRADGDAAEMTVGPEQTKTDASLTMYFHSAGQVADWVASAGFTPLRCLAFTVPMDRDRTRSQNVKAYLVRKGSNAP